MVYTKRFSTSAVVEMSLELLGWQPGTAKFREHDFPQKKRPRCLKFTGLVKSILVLSLSETMHMVSAEHY